MARASSVLVKTEEPAEAYKKSNKNNKKYTRRAVKKASRIKPRKVKVSSETSGEDLAKKGVAFAYRPRLAHADGRALDQASWMMIILQSLPSADSVSYHTHLGVCSPRASSSSSAPRYVLPSCHSNE